jgi:hypothetical protein
MTDPLSPIFRMHGDIRVANHDVFNHTGNSNLFDIDPDMGYDYLLVDHLEAIDINKSDSDQEMVFLE